MLNRTAQRTAVIGTGLAGAVCAHSLTQSGHSVVVFDKSRGPGGRLATRRLSWVSADGQSHMARLDHGALGLTAQSAGFQAFIAEAVGAGWLAQWLPRRANAHPPSDGGGRLWVPIPTLPALCQNLVGDLPAVWGMAVDGLLKGSDGWRVNGGGRWHNGAFDSVIVALPPAQAAPLLTLHRNDWARQASVVPMQPCWTLMGVADAPDPVIDWELAQPADGPLAWALRSDSRPGRTCEPGQAHWVAHARPGWSRRHLEHDPAWVRQELQAALAEALGQPVRWHHSAVHRWRYALPRTPSAAPAEASWWDAALGLGVCGDFLGGCGAEGAWLSAQSLCAAWQQQPSRRSQPPPSARVADTAMPAEKPMAAVRPGG